MAPSDSDTARTAGQMPDASDRDSASRAPEAGRRQPAARTRTVLGTVDGGGELAWRAGAGVFELDGAPVRLARVRALDARGLVRWRFLEQRDWMRRLPPGPCDAAFEREVERFEEGLTPAERLDAQIRRHVRKDNSYLHGHIVEEPAGDDAGGALDPGGTDAGQGTTEPASAAPTASERETGPDTAGTAGRTDTAGKHGKRNKRAKREKSDKPAAFRRHGRASKQRSE